MAIWLLFLSLTFLLLPSYAARSVVEHSRLNNEKNTMQLVTIEMPDHAVLRKPAQTIVFSLNSETKEFIQTLQAFFDNLKSPLGKPAGLAAPQVSHSIRIIIIQIPPAAKEKRKDVYDTLPPTVLINSVYTPVLQAGQSKDWEGCFSVPDKMGELYRYHEIHYEAYTIEGKKITGDAKGLQARLLQNEIDHLNDKLYIDHLRADCCYDSFPAVLKIIQAKKKTTLLHHNSA